MSADTSTSTLWEATVCAAGIIVGGFWEAALRLPEPDDFDDADLGELWTAILDARSRGPVTKVTVQAVLRDLGWDAAKAFRALKSAQDSYLSLPESLAAVDQILKRKLRRQGMAVCRETLKELETAVDVASVLQRHEIRVMDVASRGDEADHWERGEEVREERLERLETGIETFDRVNGGLASGVLTILAARPGMGKSAWAAAVVRNVSKRGLGAGFNSLEMPSLDLIHRAAAAEAYDPAWFDADHPQGGDTNPTYSDYERKLLHGEILEHFEKAKAAIKRLPIRWDEKQGRTISQIRMGGRRLKTLFGREAIDLRLMVVDHLGKIYPDKRNPRRDIEIGDISDGLMQMAAELRIPVLALAQLSRAVESREDKRPRLEDLRDSGRLEEDAHTVLLGYRQAYYDDHARERGEEIDEEVAVTERYVMELNTAKFRGGNTRRVKLFCDIGRNFIGDEHLARRYMQRAKQAEMFA